MSDTHKNMLDVGYFHKKLSLVIRDLASYTREELATELHRLANTASPHSQKADTSAATVKETLLHAAGVVELYDDATLMRSNH